MNDRHKKEKENLGCRGKTSEIEILEGMDWRDVISASIDTQWGRKSGLWVILLTIVHKRERETDAQ